MVLFLFHYYYCHNITALLTLAPERIFHAGNDALRHTRRTVSPLLHNSRKETTKAADAIKYVGRGERVV